MEMSALFTPNELDRTIGDFRVGLVVQRHPDRKAARGVFSNDLNTGNQGDPAPGRQSELYFPFAISQSQNEEQTGMLRPCSAE